MDHVNIIPPAPPSEDFNEGVTNVLMATEELRQSLGTVTEDRGVTVMQVMQWREALEGCLQILDSLARWTDDAVAELESDLFRHLHLKVQQIAQQAFQESLKVQEAVVNADQDNNNDNDNENDGDTHHDPRDCQGAIARMAEINLLLAANGNMRGLSQPQQQPEGTNGSDSSDIDTIIESYAAYQRQVLRARAKPAIAKLVQKRRQGFTDQQTQIPAMAVQHHDDDDDEHDQNGENGTPTPPIIEHHHAPVLTVILGEAAALIHPLSEWLVNLPPDVHDGIVAAVRKLCSDSIRVLDEQAQVLTKTVSDWFWEDRPVDEWIQRSAAEDNVNGNPDALANLDGLVEEMAFGCQVQARYQSLIDSTGCQSLQPTIGKELLPEWTWKYASLERFLAMQQWQSSLALAAPVHIVIGTDIQVPSVVEDAQYLSVRAVERAASTRSVQAIGTVGHAVSHDVWSIEEKGSVYQALLDQRGCWSEPVVEEKEEERVMVKVKDTGFAASLLDALDDDLGIKGPPPTKKISTPISSAPASGNFLRFKIAGGMDNKMEQIQLDTQFCALNGIHAASGACQSLVAFLDSLLSSDDPSSQQLDVAGGDSKAMAMIQLGREELCRYAEAYRVLLTMQIEGMLEQWCGFGVEVSSRSKKGLCLDNLRSFLAQEDYNLDAARFNAAEADERLDRELLGPLKESRMLKQLPDKCESDILRQVGERIVSILVELILDCLWNTDKKFTDWGSLLLSKQIRKLQGFVAETMSQQSSNGDTSAVAPNFIQRWERLSQTLTVLQLEKPSDWLAYQATSILSPEELRQTLSLRVAFSVHSIQAVVSTVSKSSTEHPQN
jgi:hypothetical protein